MQYNSGADGVWMNKQTAAAKIKASTVAWKQGGNRGWGSGKHTVIPSSPTAWGSFETKFLKKIHKLALLVCIHAKWATFSHINCLLFTRICRGLWGFVLQYFVICVYFLYVCMSLLISPFRNRYFREIEPCQIVIKTLFIQLWILSIGVDYVSCFKYSCQINWSLFLSFYFVFVFLFLLFSLLGI